MTGGAQLESRVGIFWLLGNRLILDATPLSGAELYGDYLGHPTSHDDYWAEQQRLGAVPSDMEYLEPPRGRVVYKKMIQRFALYSDRCILKKKSVVSQIMKAMHLPPENTDVTTDGPDGHYKCSHCLESSDNREGDSWD